MGFCYLISKDQIRYSALEHVTYIQSSKRRKLRQYYLLQSQMYNFNGVFLKYSCLYVVMQGGVSRNAEGRNVVGVRLSSARKYVFMLCEINGLFYTCIRTEVVINVSVL